MKARIELLGFLLLLPWVLTAQKTGDPAVVFLRDGSELNGTLVAKEARGVIRLELQNGQVLQFSEEEIVRIRKGARDPIAPSAWYHGLHMQGNLGQTFQSDLAAGIGLHYQTGYQWDVHWRTGIGTGIDLYSLGQPWRVIPVFGKAEWLFEARQPFGFELAAGYGWGLSDASANREAEQGGFRLELGVHRFWKTRSGARLQTGVGYLQQSCVFRTQNPWWNEESFLQSFTFKRWTLEVAVVF